MNTSAPVRILIAIAGQMGSGKSSVAKALADLLGGQRRGYGDAVRAEATRRGLPHDRTTLQNLGDTLIAEGWPRFTQLVIDTVDSFADVVVVDGVRHIEALRQLTIASDGRILVSVFIAAPRSVCVERLVERDGLTAATVEAAMSHANEAGVLALGGVVDIVVSNETEVDITQLVARIRELASSK